MNKLIIILVLLCSFSKLFANNELVIETIKKIEIGHSLNTLYAVDKGNTGVTDSRNFDISEVLLLSVTEENGRVSLGYWSNSNTYNSFTDRPKNFIAKRLVKYNGEINSQTGVYNFDSNYEDEDSEIFVPNKSPGTAILTYDNDDNYSRWIPNTGELFKIDSITVPNADQERFRNSTVIIEPPSDLYYDTTEAEHNSSNTGNNILVNKGDGFIFYAINNSTSQLGTHEDYIKLATFKLNTSSTNEYDRYTIEYNEKIFNNNGTCKNGFSLKHKRGEGIQFSFKNTKTISFGIKPLETNIRPGDDLLLNFSFISNQESIPVQVQKQDRIAVYDKKMLWRANLYIDEGQDWNNKNRWNAPSKVTEIVYGQDNNKSYVSFNSNFEQIIDTTEKMWYGANEWNKISNVDTDTSETLNQYRDGNGGQVVSLLPYTPVWKISSGSKVGSVPYSYPKKDNSFDLKGHMDSPFDFNRKLIIQKKSMSYYYSFTGKSYVKSREKPEWINKTVGADFLTDDKYKETVHATINSNRPWEKDTLVKWNKTTAPENKWTNYIWNKVYNIIPFVPSLGLHYKYSGLSDLNGLNPGLIRDKEEIGADCIGFAQRAASYDNNSYNWKNLPKGYAVTSETTYSGGSQRNYPRPSQKDSYLILTKSDFDSLDNKLRTKTIVPGDIFYWNIYGGNGIMLSSHLAIIQEVNYDEDNVADKEITLIESTYGDYSSDKIQSTINTNDLLNNYVDNVKNPWNLYRLKSKEQE